MAVGELVNRWLAAKDETPGALVVSLDISARDSVSANSALDCLRTAEDAGRLVRREQLRSDPAQIVPRRERPRIAVREHRQFRRFEDQTRHRITEREGGRVPSAAAPHRLEGVWMRLAIETSSYRSSPNSLLN